MECYGKLYKIKVNEYFTSLLVEYDYNNNNQLSSGTKAYVKSNILQFLKFIKNKGHKVLKKVSLFDLRDFLLHTSPSHRGSMGNVLLSMRLFFKYLNENRITDLRIETILQKPAGPRRKILPLL